MSTILVAGLLNVETTVRVDGFPIEYEPLHFSTHGIHSAVGGVGYNIAKALDTLGDIVRLHGVLGDDTAGRAIREELFLLKIPEGDIHNVLDATPQSVILYDPATDGRRMIHSDLKDIQNATYPLNDIQWDDVDIAVLSNVNFTRPMLMRAKRQAVRIVTDVHTISQLDDDYNRDYMAAADILFMSDEKLPVAPQAWVQQVQAEYETPIIVVGMGAKGALLAVREDDRIDHVPARTLRPVVSTIGSGDALLSAFVHSYARQGDPYIAIRQAVLFAGYKIGSVSASEGFMTEQELQAAYKKIYG